MLRPENITILIRNLDENLYNKNEKKNKKIPHCGNSSKITKIVSRSNLPYLNNEFKHINFYQQSGRNVFIYIKCNSN